MEVRGTHCILCMIMRMIAVLTTPVFSFSLQMVTRTKKIFVGGLSAPSTLEDVKNYFEQFGRVSQFTIGNQEVYYIGGSRSVTIAPFTCFPKKKSVKKVSGKNPDFHSKNPRWSETIR